MEKIKKINRTKQQISFLQGEADRNGFQQEFLNVLFLKSRSVLPSQHSPLSNKVISSHRP